MTLMFPMLFRRTLLASTTLVLACLGARSMGQEAYKHPYESARLPSGALTLEELSSGGIDRSAKQRALPSLGIRFGAPVPGGVLVQSVERRGPAERKKILPGDIIQSIGPTHTHDQDDVDRALGALELGRPVRLIVARPSVRKKLRIPNSKPKGKPGFEWKRTRGRFVVTKVEPRSEAYRLGLRQGDPFRSFGKTRLKSSGHVKRLLSKLDEIVISVRRKGMRFSPTLKPAPTRTRRKLNWKGKHFKLAVVLVEFQDVRHNPKYRRVDFERMLFSKGEYRRAPDGRQVFGSMRDYYQEVSAGQFDLDGAVFDWVRAPEDWAYYDWQDLGVRDPERSSIFQDALKALKKREGSKALDAYQGVVFIYAGPRRSERGSQLWPHRSQIRTGKRSVPYYIVEEGGEGFGSIGVHCHEFGHMLGLPDFYGYGHRTGIGRFCTMAVGHLGAGQSKKDRPFHFCAYCKIQLGWLTPKTIDPKRMQQILLRPIEGSRTEALKIPLTPSGDEYYLLEVRSRIGFDRDFFRDGLVIWHVGEQGQAAKGQIAVPIDLEEAHGKRYFDASLREEEAIQFPNRRSDAFTPTTWPSSRSNLGSARKVSLTGMRVYRPLRARKDARAPAGSVYFTIGDDAAASRVVQKEPAQPSYPKEPVMEIDPVTELEVPFKIDKDNVARPGPNIMPRKSKQGAGPRSKRKKD